jgi:adenylate cyclase
LQAIEIDTAFAGGYKGLAVAYMNTAALLQTRNQTEAYSSAEALSRRAIALDGTDAEAHSCLPAAMLCHGDYEGALAEAEVALAMSPNLALAHGAFGETLIHSGRLKEGLAAVETSIRLDPRDPKLVIRLNNLAVGLYFVGEYEAAFEAAKRAVRSNPEYPLPYRWLAAALGQLGRIAEAKDALEKAIAIAPATFDMYVRQRVPWHRPEDHATCSKACVRPDGRVNSGSVSAVSGRGGVQPLAEIASAGERTSPFVVPVAGQSCRCPDSAIEACNCAGGAVFT